jgi:hypothetical protein
MIRAIKLYGTTDSAGDLIVTADLPVVGLLHSVEWIDGSFAVGVDAVLSLDRDNDAVDITLLTLTNANADKVYYTRYLASDDAGADLDTAGDATYTKGFVSGKLKLVVSDGGDTKSGGCIVYVEA